MNRAIVKTSQDLIAKNKARTLEQLLIGGDLAGLSESQRLDYVNRICKMTGVSILTRPFDYIILNGKLVLYANRSCTEQLRRINRISTKIVSREKIGDLYVVTGEFTEMKGKRTDSAIGAVNISGLRGQELANAMMKAETKCKRRGTLSICGLGILDEVEAKEMAEKEAKEAAQEAVTLVQEKVADSEERPDFESVQAPAPDPEPGSTKPEATTIGDYILRAGKPKGKRLKDMPLSKLATWMDFFDKKVKDGTEVDLSEDVHLDAAAIKIFLAESMFTEKETL